MNFIIGYYNGGDIALLSDDAQPRWHKVHIGRLASDSEAFQRHNLFSAFARFEIRLPQIKVEAKSQAPGECVWAILQQIVNTLAIPGVTLLRSSHSMDVIAPGVSKLAVLDRIRVLLPDSQEPPILCIGDRGQWPATISPCCTVRIR